MFYDQNVPLSTRAGGTSSLPDVLLYLELERRLMRRAALPRGSAGVKGAEHFRTEAPGDGYGTPQQRDRLYGGGALLARSAKGGGPG